MDFKKLLVLLGSIAIIFKIFEKFMMVEETTRIGLRIGLDPNSKISDNEDSGDILLDELESLDSDAQEKRIEELSEYLQDRDEVGIHNREVEQEKVNHKKNNSKKTYKVKKESNKKNQGKVPKSTKGLNTRQEKIVGLLSKNKRIDTDLLKKNIKGVTVRTFRRDLDKLEKKGYLKKVGKTKGVYYVKS